MIRVRTSHWNSLGFYCFIIPAIFLLVAVEPRELNTCAEPPIRLALSDEQSLLVSSVAPIATHGMPTSPTRALSRFISAIGGFQNYAITIPSISIQNSTLLKVAL